MARRHAVAHVVAVARGDRAARLSSRVALAYAVAHWYAPQASFVLGALAAVAAIALFVCTGMIYACIRFLRSGPRR